MKSNSFEIYQDPATKVIFYFSHSDQDFTTGVMEIPPKTELPKHNRPKAFENLIQISGKCLMKVFGADGEITEHQLSIGETLRMEKGQFHIHSNPFEEISLTIFKAEGDITEIMKFIRANYQKIN